MDASRPLQSLTVLVTRPAHQSANLIARLESDGARVLQQPAIEITPYHSSEQTAIINQIKPGDWLIFISQNAVEYGLTLLDKRLLAACQLAAVGRATAKVLTSHGFTEIHTPQSGFTSEDLLNLAVFQPASIKHQHVIIVRGGDGRDLLFQQLQQRGAKTSYLDVYQRKSAKKRLTEQQVLQSDVITVSSQQGLENLLALYDVDTLQQLKQKLLIVPGKRCQQAAYDLGFNRVESAEDATDNAVRDAIIGTIQS